MESRKMVLINLFAGKEWKRRRREWICGHSGGEENGVNGEGSTDVHVLPCAKYTAGEKLLCHTRLPAW